MSEQTIDGSLMKASALSELLRGVEVPPGFGDKFGVSDTEVIAWKQELGKQLCEALFAPGKHRPGGKRTLPEPTAVLSSGERALLLDGFEAVS